MRKDEKQQCSGTSIQMASKDEPSIVINNVAHAGAVAHRCRLEAGEHTSCECACGERWVKNFKGEKGG